MEEDFSTSSMINILMYFVYRSYLFLFREIERR